MPIRPSRNFQARESLKQDQSSDTPLHVSKLVKIAIIERQKWVRFRFLRDLAFTATLGSVD
jgi:hypothetical protein